MIFALVLACIIFCFVIYTVIDNLSVKVKYNEVYIKDLPDEFNDFIILQMTDMHSKEFGKVLYNKVNNIDYDMIAFTGDMMNNKDYEMKEFRNLLNNIKNKNLIIYIDGNNGPKTFDTLNNKLTKFGEEVEKLGCKVLKDTYCVQKNDSKIYLSNFDLATNMFFYGEKFFYEEKFKQKFSHIDGNVNIGIGHKPANIKILEFISTNKVKNYRYDLIITGHYHGGQIRIPFYGAIIVPARISKEVMFPNQKLVCGLYEHKNVSQYISTGLGASKRIPLFNFRLFNTPNIDVIKLKRK
jgi:predicted MPP superfamily phosphohydrolase